MFSEEHLAFTNLQETKILMELKIKVLLTVVSSVDEYRAIYCEYTLFELVFGSISKEEVSN